MKQILKTIEYLIWESRIIALLGVIAGAVSGIILFVYGSLEILDLFQAFWQALIGKSQFIKSYSYLLTKIITAVNLYLAAMLMFVISAGIQAMFIGKMEAAAADPNSGKIMQIQSLEQFKERVINIVHIILVVLFFKYSLMMDYVNVLSLLYLAGGIVLIAGSVYLTSRK
ncbi:MAG: YqhA family protein [Spirochaetia bacterium]|nr:YqhA family protein [Spirochaetia bacterium]